MHSTHRWLFSNLTATKLKPRLKALKNTQPKTHVVISWLHLFYLYAGGNILFEEQHDLFIFDYA